MKFSLASLLALFLFIGLCHAKEIEIVVVGAYAEFGVRIQGVVRSIQGCKFIGQDDMPGQGFCLRYDIKNDNLEEKISQALIANGMPSIENGGHWWIIESGPFENINMPVK